MKIRTLSEATAIINSQRRMFLKEIEALKKENEWLKAENADLKKNSIK